MQFPLHEANISIGSSPLGKVLFYGKSPPDLIRFSRGKLTLTSAFFTKNFLEQFSVECRE